MHTLPDEVSGPIGTSTLFAAWNAAIYVAQIEDDRLSEVVRDGRYLPPEAPGYSVTMRPASLAEFDFPLGPAWAIPAEQQR